MSSWQSNVRRGGSAGIRIIDLAELHIIACVWGLAVVASVLARASFGSGGTHADFALFYETIERWRLGLAMYGPIAESNREWLPGPNFNPPQFYVIVLPFALMPFAAAFIAWTCAGLASAVYLAARTARSLNVRPTRRQAIAAAGLVLANAALASTVSAGQLSLLLAVPVCLAWVAAREGRWDVCGAWIGLAASIKPFLLIVVPFLALTRRWRALAFMAAAGAAAALCGTAVFGASALREWIAEFGAMRMDQHFHNASLSGLLARAAGAGGVRLASAANLVGLGLTLWGAVRAGDADRSWLLLMTGALLWSPLGWIYYGWLLMPPLAAMIVRGLATPLLWSGILLWLWPPFTSALADRSVAVASTVGSIYFWGLALMWLAAMRPVASGAQQTVAAG